MSSSSFSFLQVVITFVFSFSTSDHNQHQQHSRESPTHHPQDDARMSSSQGQGTPAPNGPSSSSSSSSSSKSAQTMDMFLIRGFQRIITEAQKKNTQVRDTSAEMLGESLSPPLVSPVPPSPRPETDPLFPSLSLSLLQTSSKSFHETRAPRKSLTPSISLFLHHSDDSDDDELKADPTKKKKKGTHRGFRLETPLHPQARM